jgi:hypothetical protein
MTGWMLAISRDTGLTQAIDLRLFRGSAHLPLWAVASVKEARQQLIARKSSPLAILIDELFIGDEPLATVAREFASYAPLILVARPERQSQLASLVAEGKADFVSRGDHYVPMAVALVERTLRWEEEIEAYLRSRQQACLEGESQVAAAPDDGTFSMEALRTVETMIDILDPVLAEPSRLPHAVARRLARVSDLAFDLKRGLRLRVQLSDRETAAVLETKNGY